MNLPLSFNNRTLLGADPFDSFNHILETDTVIRILIYNIYPWKATSFYQILCVAFSSGAIDREHVIFKRGPNTDFFIGEFFEKRCKGVAMLTENAFLAIAIILIIGVVGSVITSQLKAIKKLLIDANRKRQSVQKRVQ